MAIASRTHPNGVASASTAELVNRAVTQIGTLARDELALAKAELTTKGKRLGVGGGLFGLAGLLAFFGLGLALAVIAVALDIVLPAWLAVLVTMALVFVAAGAAALIGQRQVKKGGNPVPTEAVNGVSHDLRVITSAVKEGRHS